jgi:hypothetical protein
LDANENGRIEMHRSNIKRALKLAAAVLLLAAVGTSSGCLWAPNLARVRRDLEAQMPGVSFDKEIELSLGPVSLLFARLIVGVVPEAQEARGYLRDVSRVEVGVYNTDELPATRNVTTPKELTNLIENEGWEMAVRVRDEDEMMWLLYRIDGDTIKELYVVVLNEEELVLVKIKGRLERLVAHALTESGAMKDLSGQ